MNELRKAAEKEQPKALRLADDLEHPAGSSSVYRDKAAAELRRLHQSEKEAWRYADELEQERKRLTKAAEMALEALEEINKLSVGEKAVCLPAEIDGAIEALLQALAQPEQEPTLLCWGFESLGHAMLGEGEPFYPSGQKVSLSSMKPGDRFVLVRTGQIYSIKNNGAVWNETEQRAARLHKNCQVEPIVTHPKCDDACLNICTEGFSKPPNCTAPPKREWVGLSDDEVIKCFDSVAFGQVEDDLIINKHVNIFRAIHNIEAKLKEKNGG